MDIFSPIFTRKSIRKFDTTPLDAETVRQVQTFISGVKPLLPKSEFTHKIVGLEDVKAMSST